MFAHWLLSTQTERLKNKNNENTTTRIYSEAVL